MSAEARSDARDQRRLVAIGDVISGLEARIRRLVAELLPQGREEGPEYRCGSLAGDPGRSLAVHIGKARPGVWSDFSTGETGDALDLIAQVYFAGDKKQAFRWAVSWLGLDGADPRRLAVTQRAIAHAELRKANADDETAKRRARALRIYLEASPKIAGTPADWYLKSRGIDLAQLGRQPNALRFHPALFNAETNTRFPALVAAISDSAGVHVATHRTWLRPDGQGKARLIDAKMTLGSYTGGCIRLWRGASGKPLKDCPPGETVILSEGIEDGLTCALAKPDLRVLCAVSLANMARLELPDNVATVIIAAQHDHKPEALRGRDKAIQALLQQGRQVRLAFSTVGKDLNDQLQAGSPAAGGDDVPF